MTARVVEEIAGDGNRNGGNGGDDGDDLHGTTSSGNVELKRVEAAHEVTVRQRRLILYYTHAPLLDKGSGTITMQESA